MAICLSGGSKLLFGILPLIGVIIGASLQYFFTRHIENQRHLRDLRSKAYMDYLKCVCEQAQCFRNGEAAMKELQDLFARTADSKARICLYGSNKAIHAFSIFEKLGASMGNDEQRQAFTNMVSIMRVDSGSKFGARADDLQIVLMGFRK